MVVTGVSGPVGWSNVDVNVVRPSGQSLQGTVKVAVVGVGVTGIGTAVVYSVSSQSVPTQVEVVIMEMEW